MYFSMHISILFGILLDLAVAWPNPYEDGQASSSAVVSSHSIGYISGSHSKESMSQGTRTSEGRLPTSTVTSNSSHVQSTLGQFPTTDVITRTWLTTVTQTSFVPVSTLVTHSGSIIYYSTWLSLTYPTAMVTSTEYITGNMGSVVETTVVTMSFLIPPPMTYECLCPPPVRETIYVFATAGPITTATSVVFSSMTVSSSSLPDIVSTSTENESLISSIPTSSSIQTDTRGYVNPTGNSNSAGSSEPLMVSQLPNGQVVILQ